MLLHVAIVCPYHCQMIFHLMGYTIIYLSTLLWIISCFQFGIITNNAARTFLYMSFGSHFIHFC